MFSDLKEIVKGPGFMVESFLLSFLSLIEIQSAPVSSTQNVELKIWSGSNDTNSRLSFSDNWNSKFAILQKLWGGYINVIIMIVLSALCALPLYLVELFYEKSLPRAAALRVSPLPTLQHQGDIIHLHIVSSKKWTVDWREENCGSHWAVEA